MRNCVVGYRVCEWEERTEAKAPCIWHDFRRAEALRLIPKTND